MSPRDQIAELLSFSPILSLSVIAGAIALATTPLAFAFLGHMQWFNARRGRTLQRPVWWSVVCSMLLVMGVPAIFLALVVKSEKFDKDRYEFDPNLTYSTLDQGRQYDSLAKADEAVREEKKRLHTIEKDLVESVKKLDKAMLSLREAARAAPGVIDPMNEVLAQLGGIHKAIALDSPQQLVNLKAEPAEIANAPIPAAPAMVLAPIDRASIPQQPATTTAPAAARPAAGLSPPEVQAVMAATPGPQKPLAAMLPLADLPSGWLVAKILGKGAPQYIETFNAENLYEKIDGRAESFIQNGVKGMACCSFFPKGEEDNEVQLFIFELGDPLRCQAKFDAEKPEEDAKEAAIGGGGYTAAGSVFFHTASFYTIVNVAKDDPKLATFAMEVAKRVASQQKSEATASGPSAEDMFNLLPSEPKKSATKFVAQDVFGYSFLDNVFMADYSADNASFQGFIRPYDSPATAKAMMEKYLDTAKKDGATITPVEGTAAEQLIVASNPAIGLVDVVFLKGNALGGVNGASVPQAKMVESFAKDFAAKLPNPVPVLQGQKKPDEPATKPADNDKEGN